MIDQSVIDKAVELARATTGEKRATPVTTEEVRRLDRPGESFLLVHFGSPGTGGSIAAVRLGETIEVMTWAANPSGESTVAPATPDSELVWEPGGTSKSPLFPERRLKVPHTKTPRPQVPAAGGQVPAPGRQTPPSSGAPRKRPSKNG